MLWIRQWHPTPVLLPGKSHGWRLLVGYSPWGHEESDTTEWPHFHFSLSCIREGNGNPLQCSCLENPRDGGAWWAAIYGVAQTQTQLKRLSSSSSSIMLMCAHSSGLPGCFTKWKELWWAATNTEKCHMSCSPAGPHCGSGTFAQWTDLVEWRKAPGRQKKKKKQLEEERLF